MEMIKHTSLPTLVYFEVLTDVVGCFYFVVFLFFPVASFVETARL